MNRPLPFDEELGCKYPILLQNLHGNPRTTCMAWGFEISPGWYGIVDDCCYELERLNQHWSTSGNSVVADQIKEKFGELRFYFSADNPVLWDEAREIIRCAEYRSEMTCCICGESGRTQRHDGWYGTWCDDHVPWVPGHRPKDSVAK